MDGTACVSVGGGGLRGGGGGRNMVAYCLEVCICIHKLCTMSLLHLGDNEYCPSLKLEYELETCVCTTPVLILLT